MASLIVPAAGAASSGFDSEPDPLTANATTPKNFGIILYRAADVVDIFAPLKALQFLASRTQLNLYMLAETLHVVTTEPALAAMNPMNSSFWPTMNPTYTFADAPPLDVLIVPGGVGMRAPNLTAHIEFIAKTFPTLQYFLTICTGSGLAAKSGVLDGRFATTTKGAWDTILEMGPKVKWVAPARWVVDGNLWTSSGETAGIDMIYAFIKQIWGKTDADWVINRMEYIPHPQDFDPFTAMYNVSSPYHLPV